MIARADRGSHQRRLAIALLFVTPALWSVNYLVARWAVDVIAPHALALGRWLLAAAVLGAFCVGELRRQRAALRAEWRQLLVLGALGMWVCGAFVYIGARTTSALNIGLLYAASPVLIALASAGWLHERIGARAAAGGALALGGMLHILLRGQWGALLALRFDSGDLWIAVAVACWTVYSLLLRGWHSAFSPLARLTLIACAGAVVLLPFAIAEALAGWHSEWSWRSLALVAAAALLPGAGAYGAYSVMQRELGAARVGLVMYLGPLYTAGLAWAVLGEAVAAHHLVGAALILPGVYLATRK